MSYKNIFFSFNCLVHTHTQTVITTGQVKRLQEESRASTWRSDRRPRPAGSGLSLTAVARRCLEFVNLSRAFKYTSSFDGNHN